MNVCFVKTRYIFINSPVKLADNIHNTHLDVKYCKMVRLEILGILVVGVLACSAQIRMTLGDFGNDYVAYMTYTVRSKGGLSLNLYDPQGNWPLHVNPRYGTDGYTCRSALVLNNFFNKRWQTEVRPSSFLYRYNQKTTVVVKPMTTQYKVTFDFGKASYRSFAFPYRNGHKPDQCSTLTALFQSNSRCSGRLLPIIHSMGIGYPVKSLSAGRTIHIIGIAPTTGNIIIDISRGAPEKKNDARIPLRVHAAFGARNVVYFKTGVGGVFKTLKQINNGIKRKQYFVQIEITKSTYMVKECGRPVYTIQRADCDEKGEATIWVSGATVLDKIAVY